MCEWWHYYNGIYLSSQSHTSINIKIHYFQLVDDLNEEKRYRKNWPIYTSPMQIWGLDYNFDSMNDYYMTLCKVCIRKSRSIWFNFPKDLCLVQNGESCPPQCAMCDFSNYLPFYSDISMKIKCLDQLEYSSWELYLCMRIIFMHYALCIYAFTHFRSGIFSVDFIWCEMCFVLRRNPFQGIEWSPRSITK